MQKVRDRSSRRGIALILWAGGGLLLIALLGFLRFHAARLAYQLDSINESIQQYVAEETRLQQELSALVAPINIYTYCKERLGMQKVLRVEALSVGPQERLASAGSLAPRPDDTGWRASLAWLWGGERR